MAGEMSKKRKKIGKFYVNKDGEPTEHISARGGKYPFRYNQWKAIKQTKSTNEIRVLILYFRKQIKEVVHTWSEGKEKNQRIKDLRTSITMAGDWRREVLKPDENEPVDPNLKDKKNHSRTLGKN